MPRPREKGARRGRRRMRRDAMIDNELMGVRKWKGMADQEDVLRCSGFRSLKLC